MKGDKILVEEHHVKAAQQVLTIILPQITRSQEKYALSIAGESGSGKSEVGTAKKHHSSAG
jgi:ABC-type dipeptide/oligopeptide/nickel transport system ATPase subunit